MVKLNKNITKISLKYQSNIRIHFPVILSLVVAGAGIEQHGRDSSPPTHLPRHDDVTFVGSGQ